MDTLDRQIKYCAETRASLGARKVLLRNPVSARTTIIEKDVAAALSACSTFASIEEHSLRIANARNVDRSTAAQWLQSAMDSGLFVSVPESKRCFFGCAASLTPRKIDCIAIATRNRPETLRRLLNELDENVAEFGRNPHIVVLDDSDRESFQRANAEAISTLACRSSARLVHIDAKKRKQMVERLTQAASVLAKTAEFGLSRNPAFPVSMGAAQNALLLATAGRCILFLDDDIRCRMTPIPDSSEQIVLGETSVESWYFESRSEVEQCPFVPDDLLGLHERLLNVDSADWANSLVTTIGADSNTLFRRLESGEARVVASQMGILGDGGVDSPLPSYISGPETWARFAGSESLYRTAIRNRLILRGAKGFAVTHTVHSQTHCLAVDNQKCVPPFLPVMRGQDGLFGLLLAKCIPNSLFGLIPRAILHSPQEPRQFAPDAGVASCSRFSLSEAIMALISTYGAIPGAATAQRVISLGRMLHEMRCADDHEIQERLHSAIEPLFIRVLQMVQVRLDRADDRAFWRSDVLKIRDAALARLNSREDLIPADLESVRGRNGGRSGLREMVMEFADLLESWPALVESSMQFALE